MKSKEPYNLHGRETRTADRSKPKGHLFTCGRPGRGTFGTKIVDVGTEIIDLWEKGLPKADVVHIVSLLGKKRNGCSEFIYYPFQSSKESGTKPTFQAWLNARYEQRYVVYEFPTTDRMGLHPEVLAGTKRLLIKLLANGQTVIVVDSAGAERTARVCENISYGVVICGAAR